MPCMKTALACLALLLALGLYGFLIVGWGAVIAEQGFEAAITDLTTQPSLPVTAACLVLGRTLTPPRRETAVKRVRPEGFEPPTPRFEAWCSIQLSYGRVDAH
jgi:hypothetical protein